jgi:hypothetical protein
LCGHPRGRLPITGRARHNRENKKDGEDGMSGAASTGHEVDFGCYARIKASRRGRVPMLAPSNPKLMNAVDGEMHRA